MSSLNLSESVDRSLLTKLLSSDYISSVIEQNSHLSTNVIQLQEINFLRSKISQLDSQLRQNRDEIHSLQRKLATADTSHVAMQTKESSNNKLLNELSSCDIKNVLNILTDIKKTLNESESIAFESTCNFDEIGKYLKILIKFISELNEKTKLQSDVIFAVRNTNSELEAENKKLNIVIKYLKSKIEVAITQSVNSAKTSAQEAHFTDLLAQKLSIVESILMNIKIVMEKANLT